ncbi:MAG: ComF family protein [Gammaproteobacteria bacterium]|nr:ComF family protein [Gammaproteobacteria bacterium]
MRLVNQWHMDMVYNWLKLHHTCRLCQGRHRADSPFCPDCMASLPWLERACSRCGMPVQVAGNADCGHCQQLQPWFDRCQALFQYQAPLPHLVQQFKFHARLDILRLLGRIMAAEFARLDPADRPQALLPVPLHGRRLRWRGFNQALELARPIARRLQIPIETKLVRRTRATREQSHLKPIERRRNVKHAFSLQRDIGYRHLVIIDDVVTTAHTVNELSRVLKLAGVERVDIWCLCRAGGH